MIPHLREDSLDGRAAAQARAELMNVVMTQVYWWMAVGLGLTGLVAFGVAHTPAIRDLVFGNPIVFFGCIIAELGLVVVLSMALPRLSPQAATALFVAYSGLNGVTLSFIFMVYTSASIASTFFVTAGTFGAMAFYGTVTKKDLSGWGSFLFMGLIGIIIASIVNVFVHSEMLYWGITFAGVLVFVGLTAYDVQKIRAMAASGQLPGDKLAIYGALRLYLDFINLFLMLLRILGRRR